MDNLFSQRAPSTKHNFLYALVLMSGDQGSSQSFLMNCMFRPPYIQYTPDGRYFLFLCMLYVVILIIFSYDSRVSSYHIKCTLLRVE